MTTIKLFLKAEQKEKIRLESALAAVNERIYLLQEEIESIRGMQKASKKAKSEGFDSIRDKKLLWNQD